MARQNPVDDLKRAVDAHADAAIGTHVRIVRGAAEVGDRILDAGQRGAAAVRRWWNDDGRGPRRTTDIRLPNEGRRRRNNQRSTGRR